MALLECKCYSDSLGKSVAFNVIYPEQTSSQIGMQGSALKNEVPVLYLLHGYSDDHSIWSRRTSIERYASDMGLAVVMPDGDLSYYTNMLKGQNYFDFISKELPLKVKQIFNISDKREDTFIAGLSMGGYGAFKHALSSPEQYSAAASLSGVTDLAEQIHENWSETRLDSIRLIFGEDLKIKDSEHDLIFLLNKLQKNKAPKLFQCCGTEDVLYKGNINFKKIAESKGIDFTYQEGPGSHDWGYWDQMIQSVLKWLPIKK